MTLWTVVCQPPQLTGLCSFQEASGEKCVYLSFQLLEATCIPWLTAPHPLSDSDLPAFLLGGHCETFRAHRSNPGRSSQPQIFILIFLCICFCLGWVSDALYSFMSSCHHNSGGYSLVVVCGLLIAVASPVVEHRL